MVRIPISGIDTQVDEYSPLDGSCAGIDKLRPTGRVEKPGWTPIHDLDIISLDTEDKTKISAYYAFDRWYVAVDSQPDFQVYSMSLSGSTWVLDTQLLSYDINAIFSDSVQDVVDEISWSLINNRLYLCISSLNYNFNLIFSINENTILPHVIKPKYSVYEVTLNDDSADVADFNQLYPPEAKVTRVATGANTGPAKIRGGAFVRGSGGGSTNRSITSSARTSTANKVPESAPEPASPDPGTIISGGSYPGILKNKDKWFGVIYAWKLPNGVWVKHSEPYAMYVAQQSSDPATSIEWTTITFAPVSTYTDNQTNYDANTALFDDHQFNYSGAYEDITLEMGIFMTTAKETEESAFLEGTYFKVGDISNPEINSFTWSDNEELIPTGEVLNIDPMSHHVITSKRIKDYRNNLSLIQTVTNFALPGWNWGYDNGFGDDRGHTLKTQFGKVRYGDSGFQDHTYALRVKIETEKGIFYRINHVKLTYVNGPPIATWIASYLSYPDRRATEMEVYFYADPSEPTFNNGQYLLLETFQLVPHPFLNIAYQYTKNIADRIHGIDDGDTVLDFTENDQVLVEEDRVQFSDISKIHYPLEWTYRMNDEIMSIHDNVDAPGDERFGDYPIYFLNKNSIMAGMEGDGILVAKIDTLVPDIGIKSPNAFDVYLNRLFFISDSGIHALVGRIVEDIYDRVEDGLIFRVASASSIVSANCYSSLISASEVSVAAHKEKREILFTSNGGNTILIFNVKYNQWYNFNYVNTGSGSFSTLFGSLFRITEGTFILSTGGQVWQWAGSGNDTSIPNIFSLVTNPIVLDGYAFFKRIRSSVLEGFMSIPSGGSLLVMLQGKRTTNGSDWVTLISYTESTEKDIRSFYLRSNYGSWQAYRIVIRGVNMDSDTVINDLLLGYQVRNERFKI